MRKFSFTLHYYSPRSFFLREKFNKHLPDVSCIRDWASKCTEEGEPGISVEGLRQLKRIADEMNAQGKEFYCSLAWDEMNIRRHVSWNEAKNKFLGFITYGRKNEDGELPVARQALVFLVTGLNVKVSIPIAHFFIKGLKGREKQTLKNRMIAEITRVGAKVINVTFDGYENNFTACRLSGASFKWSDMRPFFPNPVDGKNVFVNVDNCHSFKLVRNCLGSEKVLIDSNGEKIEWIYFERLERCRIKNDLVTHNVTKKHIQWTRNKMCVRLAVQLFSRSVADSLSFLKNHGYAGFENCGPLIKFVRIFDKLFNIFNSKEFISGDIFKSPISRDTAMEIFKFLDEVLVYITSLKIGTTNILKTRKRTGITRNSPISPLRIIKQKINFNQFCFFFRFCGLCYQYYEP